MQLWGNEDEIEMSEKQVDEALSLLRPKVGTADANEVAEEMYKLANDSLLSHAKLLGRACLIGYMKMLYPKNGDS